MLSKMRIKNKDLDSDNYAKIFTEDEYKRLFRRGIIAQLVGAVKVTE